MRIAIACLVAASACGGSQFHRPPADPDEPDPPPPAGRAAGPLSVRTPIAQTSWPRRQELRQIHDRHYIGRDGLAEDVAAYLAVVDELFVPHSDEQRIGVEVAHKVSMLPGLAPYSTTSTTLSFLQEGERLDLCVRAPYEMWPCFEIEPPPPYSGPPFDVSEPAPGVALLAIHDLGAAAWPDFDAAMDRLAKARAIVIDMRFATGSDPRPLLPWLERVTGRAPLTPLRAIERPASVERYVAAYDAMYASESRDRAVWQELVGAMAPPRGTPTSQPIAVVVGRHCEAACELAARTLVAYAGATLFGGVVKGPRLGRDEPAMVRLPHSKVDVYFLATTYLLDDAIEAATGPTTPWLPLDGPDGDPTAYAVRDVQTRLAGGWPRCDSFPTTPPPALAAKVSGSPAMCPRADISIFSDAPPSLLQRYVDTCAGKLRVAGLIPKRFTLTGSPSPAVLVQLAQGELVTRVSVECHVDPEPN